MFSPIASNPINLKSKAMEYQTKCACFMKRMEQGERRKKVLLVSQPALFGLQRKLTDRGEGKEEKKRIGSSIRVEKLD
jgi:hypothetical protein